MSDAPFYTPLPLPDRPYSPFDTLWPVGWSPAFSFSSADESATTLGLDYPEDAIVVASGARPALYAAYRCLVSPGETVVTGEMKIAAPKSGANQSGPPGPPPFMGR